MTVIVCVPLETTGTVAPVLGKAGHVATARVDNGTITDWTEYPVAWDTTYGVDVPGVHHPRVVRFMRDHEVTAVVADGVCDSMQTVLASIGVEVRTGHRGDARAAVLTTA